MFGRPLGTEGRAKREPHHRRRKHFGSNPRVATALGSALGVVIVLAVASALGIGAVGFATSVAVGMVLGGWAGGEIGERQARKRAPREALRRRRSIRIFRITRTLRRRRLNRANLAVRQTGFTAWCGRLTNPKCNRNRARRAFAGNAFRYRAPLRARVGVPRPEAGGSPVLATGGRTWPAAPI